MHRGWAAQNGIFESKNDMSRPSNFLYQDGKRGVKCKSIRKGIVIVGRRWGGIIHPASSTLKKGRKPVRAASPGWTSWNGLPGEDGVQGKGKEMPEIVNLEPLTNTCYQGSNGVFPQG